MQEAGGRQSLREVFVPVRIKLLNKSEQFVYQTFPESIMPVLPGRPAAVDEDKKARFHSSGGSIQSQLDTWRNEAS